MGEIAKASIPHLYLPLPHSIFRSLSVSIPRSTASSILSPPPHFSPLLPYSVTLSHPPSHTPQSLLSPLIFFFLLPSPPPSSSSSLSAGNICYKSWPPWHTPKHTHTHTHTHAKNTATASCTLWRLTYIVNHALSLHRLCSYILMSAVCVCVRVCVCAVKIRMI